LLEPDYDFASLHNAQVLELKIEQSGLKLLDRLKVHLEKVRFGRLLKNLKTGLE